jgi:opacity protein-like surface antigen
MFLEVLATASIGLGLNTKVGSEHAIDYREGPAVYLKLGEGLYGWGSFTKGKNYVLGQKISYSYIAGLGAGYEVEFNPVITGFMEAGIGYPINKNNYKIQQEVTYTYLVGRHNVDESRPVPVPERPYDQDAYKSDWDIDAGVMLRAGVSFDVTEKISADFSYRFFNPKGYIAIWDQESVDAGGGYWEENVNVNMNVVEFRIFYNF